MRHPQGLERDDASRTAQDPARVSAARTAGRERLAQ